MKKSAGIGLSTLLLLTGCITPGEGPQLNMVSTEEEIKIGRQMAAEIEREERPLANPAMQKYVRDIGSRIARYAPRQDVPYEFTVIENDEQVNAFALPGGHMYIYIGLLRICDNEAQLASVMAHEIAHVAAYHHGESITRQMNAELIQSIVLGRSQSELARVVGQITGTSIAMWFSRAQEREADEMGINMLFKAGYKPEAMVDFMRKLESYEQQQGGAPPRFLSFLNSHPPTAERIANLEVLLQQFPLELRNQSPTYFDRYKANVLDRLN